ncbi:unnamed protein product [Phytophthora lilii]|uniref:Unnamed protein product n=1 Tax=Phytophthora lilii TaxID=2077276 RepID=A0A9W6WT63_9STRA|nr:unnamed protein product [Phytophthora lilii]
MYSRFRCFNQMVSPSFPAASRCIVFDTVSFLHGIQTSTTTLHNLYLYSAPSIILQTKKFVSKTEKFTLHVTQVRDTSLSRSSDLYRRSRVIPAMSAHVPLDALEPTLTDVLAFLDAFESDATASTAGSSDDGRRSPPSAAERRKTRKAAASRRCQQKKRAELLALRAQVAALETRVGELKQARKTHATSGLNLDKTQPLQVWRDRARLEQQLRQQSEQRNQQLQLVVARQSQVARAVRSVLDNVTSVVHFEEALRTPPPTSVLGEFVPNLNDAIYNELATRLGRIYVDTNSMFSSLDEIVVKDVSTGVQVRRDAVTGLPYVELTAAMKTSLEMNQAEKILMNMSTCHYKKYVSLRKYLTEQGIKKETELELREEELAVALSTMSLSRKYEEDNRLILTFSSLVCDHPTKSAMRFHEEGFIVLSQSPMSPQSGAVIQSRYRLTPDMDSWVSATQNTETVKMFVLEKLGSMMWSNIQRIQANCIEAQSNPASIPAF